MRGYGNLVAARASLAALILGTLWAPGIALSSTALSPKKPFGYDTSGVVGIGADPASVNGPAVLQFDGVTDATFNPKFTEPINLGQFVASPSTSATGQTTTYTDTPFEVEIKAPEFNKTSSIPILDRVFPTLGKKLDLKTEVENSLLLTGHLDGTVGPNGQVNITATVDSIKLGSMDAPTSDHATHYAFPIRYSQLVLPTGWSMSTTTGSLTIPSTSSATTLTSTSTTSTTTASTGTIPAPAAEMLAAASSSPTTPATTGSIIPAPAAEMLVASPTPTPEPSTIVFFATALGGLIVGRRRLLAR